MGYVGSALLGLSLNWPDAGAITAIAFIGSIILWQLQKNDTKK